MPTHTHMPPHTHAHALTHTHGAATATPTPQLSSGPSSSGSSPGSVAHSLAASSSVSSSARYANGGPLGPLSGASSRPSSPPLWAQQHHGGGAGAVGKPPHPQAHPHHHLAHSVRLAFGMTPIHPQPPRDAYAHTHAHAHAQGGGGGERAIWTGGAASVSPPAGRAWPLSQPHSGAATPLRGAVYASASVPASRAGSPPIKLAPLRIASPGDGAGGLGAGKVEEVEAAAAVREEVGAARGEEVGVGAKVALPGFSEVEAATRMDARA